MKTGINLSSLWSKASSLQLMPYIKEAGFDAVFWDDGEKEMTSVEIAKALKEHDLIFQSIHAPFSLIENMWEPGEIGEAALKQQLDSLYGCARAEVPILVCHVFKGFGEETPNDLGIERFGKLLDEAEKLGVTCAFENTEGEKYLEMIKAHLWNHKALGFCIDTGHEMCYNRSNDMIGKYGDKLVATHLNDNLKITGDEITWLDDAHLMPFDGKADRQNIADRLKKAGCPDILTFELTTNSKPGRNTHDIYASLDIPGFLKLAHEKAMQFAALF